MGPLAQDFFAAFGLGEDDKHITTIDADGVALAAIQALYRAEPGERRADPQAHAKSCGAAEARGAAGTS